ncbi:MAG: phosphate starvation-inducible protein PhoH, partial [Clostridiales bacterium]|nr:phosphate starvation-inducible protein PhoH [Clostridiales bacterium]
MEHEKIQINNEFISEVFGKFDENIKKLENAFSVSIVNRDNGIIISGKDKNIQTAKKVLYAITETANKGEIIDEQKINYYISELKEKSVEEIQEIN